MTEENKDVNSEESNNGIGDATAESNNTDISHMIPKDRFDEVNAQAKEYKRQLEAKDKALKDAQKANLKEKEEYKKLYEQTEIELSKLQPIADQVESWKETMDRVLEAQIEQIPEDMRGLIPDEMTVKQKLDYIARNKARLIKPTAPSIGAGERGAGISNKRALNPQEKAVAEKFGYSEDEYRKYMDD